MKVRYFTSNVKRRAADAGAGQRQQIFLRALATLKPTLTFHYGYFQRNIVRRPVSYKHKTLARLLLRRQSVRVIDYKEKGSDVNLAALLLTDAFHGKSDAAAVISDDSDLALPIELVKRYLKEGVTVLNPNVPRAEQARRLRKVATHYRTVSDAAFAACVFPEELTDRKGRFTKPPAW